MTRAPTLKLRLYVLVTAAGSLAGLASGRPELVALAAPFAAYVALGLALAERPGVRIAVELPPRVLEQDEFEVAITVESATPIERLALSLEPGPSLTAVGGRPRAVVRLRRGGHRVVCFGLATTRWGAPSAGVLACRARDRFGLLEYDWAPVRLGAVRVFPKLETLRALIAPLELQATSGSRVSRERGDGVEFADLRPFVPGDRLRRINWRATARRGTPYVSDRHPERNADVILFLDTFVDAGDRRGGTLELAVRATASLASAYLARRDRVGVIGFGGSLSGLRAGLGTGHLYRIVDALLGSEVVLSYAHKDVTLVPRGLLPPKSLVVAITPLIDERSIGALVDLRARGFDLAVVEVSPVQFAPPPAGRTEALAHRVWLLRREAIRVRLHELGVPVTEWRGQPLQVPVAAASSFRRRIRHTAAA